MPIRRRWASCALPSSSPTAGPISPASDYGRGSSVGRGRQTASVPLIIVAGQEYGTGSSRDWAARRSAFSRRLRTLTVRGRCLPASARSAVSQSLGSTPFPPPPSPGGTPRRMARERGASSAPRCAPRSRPRAGRWGQRDACATAGVDACATGAHGAVGLKSELLSRASRLPAAAVQHSERADEQEHRGGGFGHGRRERDVAGGSRLLAGEVLARH